MLPQPLYRIPFSAFFSSARPHFSQSHKISQYSSKCLNLVDILVSKPKKLAKKSSSGSRIWAKNKFCKQHNCQLITSASPQIRHRTVLQAPLFWPFGPSAAHPYLNESWLPPPPGSWSIDLLIHVALTRSGVLNRWPMGKIIRPPTISLIGPYLSTLKYKEIIRACSGVHLALRHVSFNRLWSFVAQHRN